ncbi:MAG: hypothetical protein ACJ8BF_11545 [Gemmatimonadales bacterium]
MSQMLDDRFDDLLRDAARDYNEPPETPRDVMWERIVAERTPLRPLHRLRPLSWAAGIAALLALGIGLGRLSVDRTPVVIAPSPVANELAPRVSAAAYQLATTEHLSQSEAFLTLFRASLRGGQGHERLASASARQLLATNRLLLDSPAATDRNTRLLLQDLELVLAEIAQLSPQPRARDLDLITQGLEQGAVLSRLRTAVPAGVSSTQGAL